MVAAMVAAAPAIVALNSAPASAAGCYGDYCSGKDPEQTGCSADAYTTASARIPGTYAYVDLRWSPSCKTNWARANWYPDPATTTISVVQCPTGYTQRGTSGSANEPAVRLCEEPPAKAGRQPAARSMKLAPTMVDIAALNRAYLETGTGGWLEDFLRAELAAVIGLDTDRHPQREVLLHGFGRIGRLLVRLLIENAEAGYGLHLRAVVVRRGSANDLVKRASLLRRDTVHAPFHGSITIDPDTYTASPEVVSSDFLGTSHTGTVDGLATICSDTNAVVYVWYDNEYGYSCQVLRVMEVMANAQRPGARTEVRRRILVPGLQVMQSIMLLGVLGRYLQLDPGLLRGGEYPVEGDLATSASSDDAVAAGDGDGRA